MKKLAIIASAILIGLTSLSIFVTVPGIQELLGGVSAQSQIVASCPDTPASEPDFRKRSPAFASELAIELRKNERSINIALPNAEAIKARKIALLTLMDEDPDTALEHVKQTKIAKGVAAKTDRCVEIATQVTGNLEILHADMTDGTAQEIYSVFDAAGNRTRLHLPKESVGQVQKFSGMDEITLSGYRLGNEFLVDPDMDAPKKKELALGSRMWEKVVATADAAVSGSTGVQQTLVIVVDFTTLTSTITNAQAHDIVFNKANTFYQANSYGKASFAGRVMGPYRLAITPSCRPDSAAYTAANNEGVDFTQYKRILVIFPIPTSCDINGLGSVGLSSVVTPDGSITASWARANPIESAIKHELGHNLGANHAQSLTCSGATLSPASTVASCGTSEYGDIYSIMGKSSSGGHMSPGHKDHIGWLATTNTKDVTTTGGTYSIETNETNSTGLKAIKFKHNNNSMFYVSYRTGGAGAALHLLESGYTKILDGNLGTSEWVLPVGATFTDPDNGAKVKVNSLTASALSVQFTPGFIDTTLPSIPAGLTAQPISPTQVNLSWAASTDNVGVAGYKIYKNGTYAASVSGTTYSSTGLKASTQYSYAILSYDAALNNSAKTATIYATTPATSDTTAPSVPTGLTATPISSSQINLAWNASTDNVGVAGYRIYKSGVLVGTTLATTRTYSNTGLAAGTSYGYKVSAYDAAGNASAQSTLVSATTLSGATAPATPTNFIASVVSNTQINLSWSAVTGATGYYGQVCAPTCGADTYLGTGTTYNATGLVGGTSYTFKVRAKNASGLYSAYAQLTATTIPNPPANLSATAVSSSQINLSWTASLGAVGYYGYACAGTTCGVETNLGAVTTFNATGLAPATSYVFKVRAIDATGRYSTYSSITKATM